MRLSVLIVMRSASGRRVSVASGPAANDLLKALNESEAHLVQPPHVSGPAAPGAKLLSGAIDIQYLEAAAAALLPSDLLDRELPGSSFGVSPDLDDARLVRLSHHLRVSQAALLIRLRDRGTISQDTYEELEGRRQSRRPGKKAKGGQYYATAINKVGRRFARNVFGAVDEGSDRSTGRRCVAGCSRALRRALSN